MLTKLMDSEQEPPPAPCAMFRAVRPRGLNPLRRIQQARSAVKRTALLLEAVNPDSDRLPT